MVKILNKQKLIDKNRNGLKFKIFNYRVKIRLGKKIQEKRIHLLNKNFKEDTNPTKGRWNSEEHRNFLKGCIKHDNSWGRVSL
jgi:hypothetical protein